MTTTQMALADFEGDWNIARRMVHADGMRARFSGAGRWQPADGGVQYAETGQLEIAGQAPLEASQRYFWDHDLNVWFADGRFFHKVPGSGGVARHWCDPDQYVVRYRFGRRPRFETLWRVTGPRKDYVMLTCYQRP